ncbi:MAG: hypothetical protein ACPLTR_08980, partial [Thermacetogeniaceae bacterium]
STGASCLLVPDGRLIGVVGRRAVEAALAGKRIPGAFYPSPVRAGLGKAVEGCRAAARAVTEGTSLAVRIGELAWWLAFFAFFGAGIIWLAGSAFKMLGLTQGLFGAVVNLSEAIGVLFQRLKTFFGKVV